jgi:hypothetical protein
LAVVQVGDALQGVQDRLRHVIAIPAGADLAELAGMHVEGVPERRAVRGPATLRRIGDAPLPTLQQQTVLGLR